MKIYTSYFYQIRFFPKNLIPLSTAHSDPQWFHQNTRNHRLQFVDKRGVLNGLRAEPFVPRFTTDDPGACFGPDYCSDIPELCVFLKKYREQLDQLNYLEMMERCHMLGKKIENRLGTDYANPDFAFIVHEAPWNSCSERRVIQEWFYDNGLRVEEWQH